MLAKLETKFAFSLAKGKRRIVMVYYKQLNETGIVAVTMELEEQMLSNILSGLGSSKHSQERQLPNTCNPTRCPSCASLPAPTTVWICLEEVNFGKIMKYFLLL